MPITTCHNKHDGRSFSNNAILCNHAECQLLFNQAAHMVTAPLHAGYGVPRSQTLQQEPNEITRCARQPHAANHIAGPVPPTVPSWNKRPMMATMAKRPFASSAFSFLLRPSTSFIGPLAFGTPRMPAFS